MTYNEQTGNGRIVAISVSLKKGVNKTNILSGYTDITGSDEYNLWLARRKAESVQNYLTQYTGVGIGRIIIQWYGKQYPVASNDTDEGRQQNRRVEFVVMGLD